MKKLIYTLFLLFVSLQLSTGQSELIVEPGPVGTLNAAITGDTTSMGERIDSNRIYVLRRDVPYVLSGTIEPANYNLQISAEPGAGKKPLLIVDSGASPVSQIFRLRGSASLSLSNVHLSGKDIIGAYNLRLIRISSDNARIVVDSCLLEEAGQSGFRIDGEAPSFFITNSVFRNLGRPFDPNNGRFIDARGNSTDTLWVENNVIYNVTSRVFRGGGGSSVNWAKINQNTFYGCGQNGFNFDGLTDLEFTNNIVYNFRFIGANDSLQLYLGGDEYWVSADTFDASVSTYIVRNNNFHTDEEIVNLFPLADSSDAGRNWIAADTFLFNEAIQAGIFMVGTGSLNISEELSFINPPPIPADFIFANARDTGDALLDALPWDFSNLEKDEIWSAVGTGAVDRYTQVHNFGYPIGSVSGSAGTEGQPLGVNPDQISPTTDIFVENNILYYPNPARDQLFIQNLDGVAIHQIVVYNLAGQAMQLHREVNSDLIQLNTSGLVRGTYILSLIDQSGQISSRKFVKQ